MENDSFLKGKRILFIQQRTWGEHIGHFLAKMAASEGARVAAITFKKSSHEFHRRQKDVAYDSLVNNDEVLEDPESVLKGRRFTLAHIARELGVESVWPLVFASREISRSYGEAFNYARKQQMSDAEITLYVQAAFAYISDIFTAFTPDIVIAPLLAEPAHQMVYYFAKKRGVKCLCCVDSKIPNVRIFSESPREDAGPFYGRVDELNAGAESDNRARAKAYVKEFRAAFKSQPNVAKLDKAISWIRHVRAQMAPYRRIWQWYAYGTGKGNYLPPLGVTLDWMPPRIVLRDHYTHAWRMRVARRFPYVPLESVGPYVYYPLQVEPEMTLDLFAPYFTNQVELARLVAMSLPEDYTLVVKDHPQMTGYRSREDLVTLSRTPNVKLIDYRIRNDEVLKGASLVVAPNSTSLIEAAFYAVPAIQFGDQGTTQKLPNVTRHTDLTTLTHVIGERIQQKLGGAEYEHRLENYVAAVYDTGYELDDYDTAWYEGTGDWARIWRMYEKELRRVLF